MTATYASRPHYADHLAPVKALLPDLDIALVASYQDVCNAREKHHRRIVRMEHGIGQSYSDRAKGYAGGDDEAEVGLFLVPNEHAARRWQTAYPAARVEVVGSPRLDDLPRREHVGEVGRSPAADTNPHQALGAGVASTSGPTSSHHNPTIATAFHWRTGANEKQNAFAHYSAALPELARRYKVIGHGHSRATRLPQFYQRHGIEYVPSFEEVCRRADLLIFDNTSAGFEFAATGRPVVVLNSPMYRRDVNHGLRYWDAATVGLQVDDASELLRIVECALDDPPEVRAVRELALDKVFAYRTGGAQRAADAIMDWAA